MYKLLFLSLLVLFSTFSVQAQQYHDADQSLPCLNKEFSIVAHIMRDSLGIAEHDSTSIRAAIEELNVHFEPICVSFSVCEFKFHNNFQYANLEEGVDDEKWAEMQSLYHNDNRINMYFISGLGDTGEAGFAGLGGITVMNASGIVIAGLDAIPHEMGHYFGLMHTFVGNGTELVDGSNCATAGDQICDTPADPFDPDNPDGLGVYINDCLFISLETDANGAYYVPDVGNIMSYYPCACGFTYDQYMKMANTYLNSSPKMW